MSSPPGEPDSVATINTDLATATVDLSQVGDPDPLSPQRLVLWIVPEFDSSSSENPGLTAVLDEFESANPGMLVEKVLKPSSGPISIQTYLASTLKVVPEQVPDVAVLPLGAVGSALENGWLKPIPEGVPADRIDDAFAFARDKAQPGGQRWAVPFAVDTALTVSFDTTPPAGWADTTSGSPLLLARPGSDASGWAPVLSFYASADGDLGALSDPDVEALSETMRFLEAGTGSGALVVADGHTARSSWNALLRAERGSAATGGGVFASQQANFPGMRWAPLPGRDGPAPPVAWGWAFVVTSHDPARAQAAGLLLTWLTDPDRRQWILGSDFVPAWIDGFEETVAALDPAPSAEYIELLGRRLEVSEAADRPEDWLDYWAAAVGEVPAFTAADLGGATLTP